MECTPKQSSVFSTKWESEQVSLNTITLCISFIFPTFITNISYLHDHFKALTRNPRVDFISKRVEEIKQKKSNVSHLSNTAATQIKQTHKTLSDLDKAMLEAFKDELGERKWDEAKGTYTRVLHTEEKRLIADMERVLNRCRETLDKVLKTYLEHLNDTAQKPLTYNTPDEDAKLATVMETKEQYKAVRTLYSDAMIDADAELATGSTQSSGAKQRLEETKSEYEQMSERLCDDALKYEHIYREELAQRVAAHFMAEQHLLKGVSSAMKDFMPYTRGLTLDWEQLRVTRRANLAAAKISSIDDDDIGISSMQNSLPRVSSGLRDDADDDDNDDDKSASNPFGNVASDLQKKASVGASALASAGKSTGKSIASFVSSHAPKGTSKTAAKTAVGKMG